MDNYELLEYSYDIANNILADHYHISNNGAEIREILNPDNGYIEAIREHLNEYYSENNPNYSRRERLNLINQSLNRFINYNNMLLGISDSESLNQNIINENINNLNQQLQDNLNIISNEQIRSDNIPNIPVVRPLNITSISDETFENLPDQVKETIIDPITMTIMNDPVINSQGNTYDRSTLSRIIRDSEQENKPILDPITRSTFSKDILIPNNEIRSLIQRYFPNAGGKKKQTRRIRKKTKRKSKKN